MSAINSNFTIKCAEPLTEDEMKEIEVIQWWLDSVIHIVISVIGLIANLMSIPVLLSKRLTNVFYRTLALLAIFDLIFIACDVLESIRISYPFNYCAEMPLYQIIHLYMFPKFLRPLQNITMVASIYTTVVVALGRYLAVSKPISTMVKSGTGNWKKVVVYILPVIVFSIAFKLPIFFEFYSEWCLSFCANNSLINDPYCGNKSMMPEEVHLTNGANITIGKDEKRTTIEMHSSLITSTTFESFKS